MQRRFGDKSLVFAAVLAFALAFMCNAAQCADGTAANSNLAPITGTNVTHGPTMPPYPWEGVQGTHGPTMPPYPWEG